jgi:Flp pilus assembly protein TadG
MVGLMLTVLVGAVGLGIDAGRLYVTKSELQSAVDACALAAAPELICTGSDTSCLNNAEAAGQTVAARNKVNLQASAASASVTFASALSGTYGAKSPALAAARHVRCTAQVSGIQPWLMGVLGAGSSTVSASAVGTSTASQDFCLSAPLALCSSTTSGANFGYTPNAWVTATSKNDDADLKGGLRWAMPGNSISANAIRDQLQGTTPICGVVQGSTMTLSNGSQQGAKSAYNTRFGLYPNGANAAAKETNPPDRTGYAYPTSALETNANVLSDYLAKRASFTPFDSNTYTGNAPGSSKKGSASGTAIKTSDDHKTYGADRRLIAVAVVGDCTKSTAPVSGTACLLMLNPMANGSQSDLYFQYLGNAKSSDSPCRNTGTPGGSSSTGPRVPVLAQ